MQKINLNEAEIYTTLILARYLVLNSRLVHVHLYEVSTPFLGAGKSHISNLEPRVQAFPKTERVGVLKER